MNLAKRRIGSIDSEIAMKQYIADNPSNLPFVKEAWETAKKEAKYENLKISEYNKNAKGSKKNRLSIGQVYQKLMSTDRYKELGEALRRKEEGVPEDIVGQDGAEETKKDSKAVDLKSCIKDMESPEGQFIYRFLTQYFGSFSEKEDVDFLVSRIRSYYGEYELNSASDEYLVMVAISDELILKRINQKRLDGSLTVLKDMKTIRDNYMSTLDGLKVLKKLADKKDSSEEHFSAWVKKLTDEGELLPDVTKPYPKDDVDRLLKAQRRSLTASIEGKETVD